MALELLLKLGGFSLIIGGCLTTAGWICFAILDPSHQHYQKRQWLPLNMLIISGGLLMSLGLSGFYFHQASEAGVGGLIGFILLFVGLVLSHLVVHSIETACMPNIPPMIRRFISIAAPSLFSGILITGISTWKAEIYPSFFAVFLIITALAGILTIIRGVPPWLGRNLASSFFPISMIWSGFLLIN